jgi:hypothetical protein
VNSVAADGTTKRSDDIIEKRIFVFNVMRCSGLS